MKKIPQEIIDALNSGQRESSNLMEFLSVDIKLLLKNVLPEFDCPIFPIPFGVTKKHRMIGAELQKQFGFAIFEKLKTHKSDTQVLTKIVTIFSIRKDKNILINK